MTDLDRNAEKRKQLTLQALRDVDDPDDVINRAPEIWKLWETNDVIPPGMTYQGFCYHLEQIYLLKAMGRV